jgi:hypothetical protein
MPETNIGSAVASDLSNAITSYSVDSASTDGATGYGEHTWQNSYWSVDYGYYLNIPEFRRAVDTKALWTVGAGFEADEPTTMLLGSIKGNGKDSFNSILKNMIRVKTISMDSFAEIIRDESDKNRPLVNLKPLDPSSIKIVQDNKGRIKKYVQVNKSDKSEREFSPEQIFHLSHDRIADEIHGTRLIQSLQWLIDARNEAMSDWRRVLHRNVEPLWIFHLDTDDSAEIAAFKGKMDKAHAAGENMYIPKGTVVPEVVAVSANATLNPLAWIDAIKDQFFQAVNVPQIIFGNAKSFTDASGKIVYLSYEQSVKEEQLYVEEQVLGQLNLEIHLTFPASLQNDLISSGEKDPMTGAVNPNDLAVNMGGNT